MPVSLFLFCKWVQLRHILDSTYKWYHMVFVFLFLTSLGMIISRSSLLMKMTLFHSLLYTRISHMHLICVSGKCLELSVISCRNVIRGNRVECAVCVCSLSYKSLLSLPLLPFPQCSSTPSHYLFICAKKKAKIKINSNI